MFAIKTIQNLPTPKNKMSKKCPNENHTIAITIILSLIILKTQLSGLALVKFVNHKSKTVPTKNPHPHPHPEGSTIRPLSICTWQKSLGGSPPRLSTLRLLFVILILARTLQLDVTLHYNIGGSPPVPTTPHHSPSSHAFCHHHHHCHRRRCCRHHHHHHRRRRHHHH